MIPAADAVRVMDVVVTAVAAAFSGCNLVTGTSLHVREPFLQQGNEGFSLKSLRLMQGFAQQVLLESRWFCFLQLLEQLLEV